MRWHRGRPTPLGPPGLRGVPRLALAAAAAIVAIAAHADVYKCAGATGTPVYQETPCPAGRELRNFQTDPPQITVLPGTPRAGSAAAAPASPGKIHEKPAAAPQAAGSAKVKGDPAQRALAHVGMSESEVLSKLGAPDVTTGRPNQKQVHWTWLPTEGDPDKVTTMTLTDGIVTDLERRTVKK
jgi:hypothetical protein